MSADNVIKTIGLLFVLVGVYQAYLTYNQSAELQAMRALHSEQLKVCSSLVEASSNLLSQNTSTDYLAAFDAFSKLKHGTVLVLLDKATIDKSVEVYNAAIAPLSHNDDKILRKKVRCSLANSPFELAISCRNLISQSFKTESGGALSPIAESYTMGWAGSCE